MEYEKDHLKLRWMSEIPRCAFDCFYPHALERGCIYQDFSCICLAIADLAIGAEACINACPVNPDQRWAPSRILDFCDLVGEKIQLPEYMNQFAGNHRRAAFNLDASYSDYSSYFSDYSTADFDSASTDNSQPTLASATPSPTAASPTEAPATLTASPTSLSTSITSTASTNTTTMTGSASSGLSTGAKAGIGVAIPVAVIILGFFVFWYLRKKGTKERNSASWTDDNSNALERSVKNTVGPLPTSQTHIAEADSNTIHESGGKSVVLSKSPNAETQGPAVYELSGNSAIKYLPPVKHSSFARSESMDKGVQPLAGGRISQKADISSSSTTATETKESKNLHIPSGDFINTGIFSQKSLQEGSMEITPRWPTSLENVDMPLSQLEAEVALIAEEKERLQQLQSLAEREAELKRQILARKSAM